MFLLDTNVVSETRRPERADAHFISWMNRTHPSDMFLSAVTVLEIEAGALLKLHSDPTQGRILLTWLETKVLPTFRGRVLPVDLAVARRCAGLHVPIRRAERDALIAATALVHDFTVATRNVREFASMSVRTANPWR